MSLYLWEMHLDVSTPEKRAKITERIEEVVKEGGTPTARLVAGPWASLENPTVVAVFEVPDLNQTMPATMELYDEGLINDTHMRPIITWEGAKAAAAKVRG
jgi:hypothetical protein